MSRSHRVTTSEATTAIVAGLVAADNATKQRYGQRIADALGFEPGPGGPDDGIDGTMSIRGKSIHFQCKLTRRPLGRQVASILFGDIKRHESDVCVLLTGVGVTAQFREQLDALLSDHNCEVCLLTLVDVFDGTENFEQAARLVPPMRKLLQVMKSFSF